MGTEFKLAYRSESFTLESPLGEPNAVHKGGSYTIERYERSDGTVTWLGIGTNWVKKPNSRWQKLENSMVDCEEPIYETLYNKWNAEQLSRLEKVSGASKKV